MSLDRSSTTADPPMPTPTRASAGGRAAVLPEPAVISFSRTALISFNETLLAPGIHNPTDPMALAPLHFPEPPDIVLFWMTGVPVPTTKTPTEAGRSPVLVPFPPSIVLNTREGDAVPVT